MNEKMKQNNGKTRVGRIAKRSAKELAVIAVFVALLLGGQTLFSALPSVEVVTLLVVTFAFSFGVSRGALAVTAFALLRNFIFGLFPNVLVLYLLYYNLLVCVFGLLGKLRKKGWKNWQTFLIVLPTACVCTAAFTAFDNVITPVFFHFNKTAWRGYALASISVMIPQIVCTFLSVGALFLPLQKAFSLAAKGLK